jgi:hypothetical protein
MTELIIFYDLPYLKLISVSIVLILPFLIPYNNTSNNFLSVPTSRSPLCVPIPIDDILILSFIYCGVFQWSLFIFLFILLNVYVPSLSQYPSNN